MNERPMGVTIMAWLAIVFGAFGVIGSVTAFFGALAIMAIGTSAAGLGAVGGGAGLAFSGIMVLISAIVLGVLAIVEIVFGIGALGLKGWAWTLGMYWCFAAIVLDIINVFASGSGFAGALLGAVLGIAVAVVILYYLFRPEVKGAFGKSAAATPSVLVGIFGWIDGLLNSSKTTPPQQQGGYQPPQQQPPQQSGGYQQPPQSPAHYEAQPPAGPSDTPPAPPA